MKYKLGFFILVAVALALCCAFAVAEESHPATLENLPQVAWMGYTIAASKVVDRPAHVTGKPPKPDDRFILVTIVSVEGTMSIKDIIENIETFYLLDPDENDYVACAFLPHEVEYVERNGVFSTAVQQSSFELLFRVPPELELGTLTLLVEEEMGGDSSEVPMAEVPKG